jgi:hypothetical protein
MGSGDPTRSLRSPVLLEIMPNGVVGEPDDAGQTGQRKAQEPLSYGCGLRQTLW